MPRIHRRDVLQAAGWGLLGASSSGWLPNLAAAAAETKRQRRHCILLWMNGGPSQLDTFDLKPGHANGGEFKEISTSAAGLKFSEHLPKLAKHADQLAVVRSLSTAEGDHGRGSYLMRTGHPPMGRVQHPSVGSFISKELATPEDQLPGYVAVSPYRVFNRDAYGPGFLGPRYTPLSVGATDNYQASQTQNEQGYAELKVDDLQLAKGIGEARAAARRRLRDDFQEAFLADHHHSAAEAQETAYRRAIRMMDSRAARAFDLEEEPAAVREAYGKGRFGQGCLMARRLIEQGVPFVEVSLGGFGGGSVGWDTHSQNFTAVKKLSAELDAGWATLIEELRERDLLDVTTIIWMGEFGRTPQINGNAGRDHFSAAWSCVFAGGGIAGGQAFGRTSPDGMRVEEGKVGVGDILATLCTALGLDPDYQNVTPDGRPIRLAEGTPIEGILA